jgi:hypothetical protein
MSGGKKATSSPSGTAAWLTRLRWQALQNGTPDTGT